MSKWNLDTVRGIYGAFARGEFPADAFHEDAEWHTDPELPRPMAHYGRPEVASYFERFVGAWHALDAEPVEMVARPSEQVLAIIRMGHAMERLEPAAALVWTPSQRVAPPVHVFGNRDPAIE